MLRVKHLSLKKRMVMLRVKHLSLKRRGRCYGQSTSVSKEEGDAAGEAPQSKKKRVMLRVKNLSLKRRG